MLEKHLKKNSRPEIVIFQSENVLSPKSLSQVLYSQIIARITEVPAGFEFPEGWRNYQYNCQYEYLI